MPVDVLMPKLGLTMTEGVLVDWTALSGDCVAAGDVLFTVETEKAAVDVEAVVDGVFRRADVSVGDTLPVGTLVGTIDTLIATSAVVGASQDTEPPREMDSTSLTDTTFHPASLIAGNKIPRKRLISTPLARVLARKSHVDLARLMGSGPGGRIKAIDVQRAHGRVPDINVNDTGNQVNAVLQAETVDDRLGVDDEPVSATLDAGHFILSIDVDMSTLEELRSKLNVDTALPDLPLTPFIVAAAGRALVDVPVVRRDSKERERKQAAGSTIAVRLPGRQGVRPVRDAGRKSVERIATELRDHVEIADSTSLTGDARAALMTVSNAGDQRVTILKPAVEPDQSLNLAVGVSRCVFRPDDQMRPVLRREMELVLVGNYRAIEDEPCITLLNRIASYLEAPFRLLCQP